MFGADNASLKANGLNRYPDIWIEVRRKLHDEKPVLLIRIERQLFTDIASGIQEKDLTKIEQSLIQAAFTATHEAWVHAKPRMEGVTPNTLAEHAGFYGISVDRYMREYDNGRTSPGLDEVKQLNPNSPASKALSEIESEVRKLKPELEKLIE